MVKTQKQIQWIYKGPNKILIKGDSSSFTALGQDSKIVKLITPNSELCVGDTFKYKRNIPYKINNIDRTKDGYELVVSYRNKSSVFIMPMFGATKDMFFYDNLFVNAFVSLEDGTPCVALLYRFSGNALFLKFEQALHQFSSFVKSVDPSPYFVLFIFDIPKKHIEDYHNFLGGKYSEFTPELKDKIIKFHGIDNDSSVAEILYKSDKRRLRLQQRLGVEISKTAELFDVPDIDEETFNPKVYI